ncbi:MAG: BatD family protein [Kiritimatiellae bacterium]|jgi:hypothetical protein|nr:BatD family protein [Kiritimatiellia bacterium]
MLKKITYIATALLLLPTILWGAISMEIKCSRATIYQGESFNLTLSINGADDGIEQPDFASSSPAKIQFLGSHGNSRSSIQIINGRITRNVFKGRVLSYSITPKNKGLYQTGPIIVRVDGKTIRDNGTKVLVKGIEKQDNVIVSVKASSTSVLVEEPFSITLSVAIKELPDPYWKSNEPLHANKLPLLSANFLEITEEKDGLVHPDLNQILNNLIDQSGREAAFAINGYKSRGMGFGSMFGSDPFKSRPIRFRLKPKQIKINGKRYREYTLILNYTATGEGEHTFGPVTFKGQIMSGVTPQREAVFTDVYTIGAAATVRVIPPPDEGRPEDFIGSVGKEMITVAQLDTTVCKVGDPLTLTLEITGKISITNLRTPELSLQPNLLRDFKIYDNNVKTETLKNGKRFTYRIRPTKAGTLEFPPINISYYDTDQHAYKTITTEPIPVQAEATTQVAASENSSYNGGVIEVKKAIPMPSGITLTADGLKKCSLIPEIKLLLPLFLGIPLLVLLGVLMTPLAELFKKLKTHRIKSSALSKTTHSIKKAKSAAKLSQAIRSYLTRRLNASGHSLTSREVAKILHSRNVPETGCREFTQLISQLDEAMYKPGGASELARMKEQSLNVIKIVDTALHNSKSKREEEL